MQLLYRHTNNYFTYCKLNRFLRAQPSAAQKTEVGEKNAQKHTNEKNRNTPAIQFTAMPLMNNPKLLHLLRDTCIRFMARQISRYATQRSVDSCDNDSFIHLLAVHKNEYFCYAYNKFHSIFVQSKNEQHQISS